MLTYEKEFFETLKCEKAKTAFKAMMQDCNDSIREMNEVRIGLTDPALVLHIVAETQKARVRMRAEAMTVACSIDAENARTVAGIAISWAHVNKD